MTLVRNLVLGLASLTLVPAATLFYQDYDAGRSASVSYNLTINNVQTEQNATLGVMLIQVNGGVWQDAFCGDAFAGIANNTTYDATASDMVAMPYTRVAWLMANALPAIVSGAQGGIQAAALQLAIWDILHDGGDGLSAGSVQQSLNTTQAVRDAFAGYLGAAWSPTLGLIRYQNTFQNTNIGAQDLLVHVPEPGTFALGGLALAGLIFGRRRK
jgi:hypothetical protein